MILFFTGTGNSEYIAKVLAKKLGDETVCMNNYILLFRSFTEAEKQKAYSNADVLTDEIANRVINGDCLPEKPCKKIQYISTIIVVIALVASIVVQKMQLNMAK